MPQQHPRPSCLLTAFLRAVVVVLVLTLVPAGSAHAEPVLPPVLAEAAWSEVDGAEPVPPKMAVSITGFATYHHVCATGSLRGEQPQFGPWWSVTINGERADGSLIQDGVSLMPGTPFSWCVNVQKLGTSSGLYTVAFTYTGSGNDRTSEVQGLGLWVNGQNYKVEGSQ